MSFETLKLWSKALRVPFSTATIIPVVLGSSLAWRDGALFLWGRFWLALGGALLIHFGTNLANDYFDHVYGNDEKNLTPTPFSGGSRVIQEGLIPAKKILFVSLASFALGSLIGIYLNYLSGTNVILWIGILGVSLGFFYTVKPLRIGYGSIGELAVGLGFGPLMVMGSYYVQANKLPFKVFLVSLPIGILIALVLLINEFPDYAADKAADKRTLVVVMGKKSAISLYHAFLAVAYVWIAFLLVLRDLPAYCGIVFLSLPLALKAYLVSRKNFDSIDPLLPANASTIGLHAFIGLLLCAGLILDRIF